MRNQPARNQPGRNQLGIRAWRTLAAALAVGAFGLTACGGADATPVAVADQTSAAAAADLPVFGLVSPEQALGLSQDESVTVIDVRTPEEFAAGHIEGATMIDFYADTFTDEIAALDPDATYLLYCRSGNRSGQTADIMAQLGFGQVYDLQGGVNAYAGQGLPLVR